MTYKQKVFNEHPLQEAQKIWKNYLLSISQSKQGFIHRYGEQEGIKRYEIFKEKSMQTQKNFIKRWGEEQGRRRWQNCIRKRNAKNPRRLEYWLDCSDGDYQLAKQKLSQYQSHSKEWFIERYGKQLGFIKYNSWSVNQKKAITLAHQQNPEIAERTSKTLKMINNKLTSQQRKQLYSVKRHCIKQYGQAQGLIRFFDIYKCRNHRFTKYSLMGVEFCEQIISLLTSDIKFDSIRYGACEKFLCNESGRLYFYDLYFRLGSTQLIVEFNGDFWHANPQIYTENYMHPVCKKTAKEIWERDCQKLELAKKNNIEVYVVWQKDFINHKQRTIENTIKIIKEVFNGRID